MRIVGRSPPLLVLLYGIIAAYNSLGSSQHRTLAAAEPICGQQHWFRVQN